MCVLDVINGVFHRLHLHHIKIKIEMARYPSHEKSETRDILSDLVHHLPKRDELACPGRHRNLFSFLVESGQLRYQNRQRILLKAERLYRRFYAGYVAMVVRAP